VFDGLGVLCPVVEDGWFCAWPEFWPDVWPVAFCWVEGWPVWFCAVPVPVWS